jgi:hypothetical protein
MSSLPSSRSVKTSGTDLRCTKCGSRVRPEQTWCSLCHTSISAPGDWGSVTELVGELGDALADEPSPVSAAASDAATADEGVRADEAVAADQSAAQVEAAQAEAALTADRLLVELAAAESGRTRESRLSALQGKLGLGGRSTAILIAGAGGVLLLTVMFLGLTLLGLLL